MSFHPEQRYMAILAMGGGKGPTWRRLKELEALQRVKREYPSGIPSVAILVLRPVDNRGTILDGFICYRRVADRWVREENHLDKAA